MKFICFLDNSIYKEVKEMSIDMKKGILYLVTSNRVPGSYTIGDVTLSRSDFIKIISFSNIPTYNAKLTRNSLLRKGYFSVDDYLTKKGEHYCKYLINFMLKKYDLVKKIKKGIFL